MAQPERIFLSTVYCWREKGGKVIKANFFSIPGSDEKHLYSIQEKVENVGDDISRGYKFIGDGTFAILPETRLKVNVEDFFNGKLTGFALRKPESSIKMNVVNAHNRDRAVRLCNVLTFDEMGETFEFCGVNFQRRPRQNQKVSKNSKTGSGNAETNKMAEDDKRKERKKSKKKKEVKKRDIGYQS